MHTTWDRFVDAREIGDLMIEGGEYVDRIFATLKDRDEEADSQFKESGDNTDDHIDHGGK
jgi:hypothetical protein